MMWGVMTLRFLLVIALSAFGVGSLAAAAATAEDEIVAAEKNWATAVVEQNVGELKRIYSEELIYAHSTGSIESRDDYLERMTSGKQRYDAIDHHKTTVRVHGTAAVAHSIVTMKGGNDGGPFDNRLMMIHTWVRAAGRWRLVAHQTTLLEKNN